MSDAVTAEIQALADANGGRLTPEMVIEAARDMASALHERFTWDDAEAAHSHRLDEARALIRSVKVQINIRNFAVRAPAFVRDPDAGRSSGYISVGTLRTDEDMAREAVIAEFARAAASLQRARAVAAVLGMEQDIGDVEARVGLLMQQAQATAEGAA